jgi:F0F1-type ATP synthase assembly protein I
MPPDRNRFGKNSGRDYKQIGILTAVPTLLLAGPLIGYVVGHWADGKLDTEPYLAVAGVVLGLVSAGLETYKLIKKASETDGDDEHE